MSTSCPPEMTSKTNSPVRKQARWIMYHDKLSVNTNSCRWLTHPCQHLVHQKWLRKQILPSEKESRWINSHEQMDEQFLTNKLTAKTSTTYFLEEKTGRWQFKTVSVIGKEIATLWKMLIRKRSLLRSLVISGSYQSMITILSLWKKGFEM